MVARLLSLARSWVAALALFIATAAPVRSVADDLIHGYEGDVQPLDVGWIRWSPCEPPCSESVENGRLIFRWPTPGGFSAFAGYGYYIATPGIDPPPTLWLEWRFRSNHPIGPFFTSCDGAFSIVYRDVHDAVQMYGDAAVSFEGGSFVSGLTLEEFHTFRFESLDGKTYTVAADGLRFINGNPSRTDNGTHVIVLRGRGGCSSDQIPDKFNEWDFVRYGTISYGEQIASSNPPQGFLDARRHTGLDRFTVTYDSPNYVYIDEITVESTDGPSPAVIATRRLDNGEPDTVQIVLDNPVPMHGTTRFTFDDGETVNVVEYTFAPGDTNGNGRVDLFDAASFQNCFGLTIAEPTTCSPLDLTRDGAIGPLDFKMLVPLLSGP